MIGDTALTPLLRRFAALSHDDREYVLGLLGQAEREALLLACSETAGTALSPALAALVDQCRSKEAPQDLTEHAARALVNAVDAATGSEPIERALRRTMPRQGGWGLSSRPRTGIP